MIAAEKALDGRRGGRREFAVATAHDVAEPSRNLTPGPSPQAEMGCLRLFGESDAQLTTAGLLAGDLPPGAVRVLNVGARRFEAGTSPQDAKNARATSGKRENRFMIVSFASDR
jgi:hypothetical protein